MGDSSDNIPGVPGVGEKDPPGALLQGLGGLDTLYVNWKIAELSFAAQKQHGGEAVEEQGHVHLSYQLAYQNRRRAGAHCRRADAQPPAADDLLALFRQYELRMDHRAKPENGCRRRGKPAAKPAVPAAAAEAEEEVEACYRTFSRALCHYPDEATLLTLDR